MWTTITKEIIQKDRDCLKTNIWPLYTYNKVLEFNGVVTDDSMVCIKTRANCHELKKLTTVEKPYYNIKYGARNQTEQLDVIKLLFDIESASKYTVVAGGFVHDFCVNKHMRGPSYRSYDDKINDIDVFFWSENPAKDTYNIGQMAKKMISKLDELSKYKIVTTHSRNSYVYNVTVYTPNSGNTITIQFVTKIFKNKSSIIGQFDVNSSAVMYDGCDILFTELSAYSYGTLHNYVDPLRKSATYEYRLHKYLNLKKGFSIAFPEASVIPSKTMKFTTEFPRVYTNITEQRNFSKLENNDVSIYGLHVGPETIVYLYNKTKYNKIYFNVDKVTGITYVDSNQIRQFYRDKYPSVYRGTIQKLAKSYPVHIFESLMHVYIQNLNGIKTATTELSIVNSYVNDIIRILDIYVFEKYNVKNRLYIDWDINDEVNPLGPEPMEPVLWYGQEFFKTL